MQGLIESQYWVGFIEGDYPQPEKYNLSDDGKTESLNPEFVQWQKSDRLLHG